MHGFIVFIQLQHLADHAETVTVSIQLGLAALGTVTIFHHHILYLHVIVHRMDRHLRLDLKSFGEYRECLHEFITERAITGHDVLDIGMKQAVDPRTHQTVAEIMKRPLIFRKISRRQAVSHHHIRLMLQNLCHHLPGTIQRIRVVSVDHKIAFRIDLTKHSADHVSLSLGIFMTYDRSRFRCQFHGTIGGIIVIYISHRLRQELFHIGYHLGDRLLFIVAGDQYCNFIHFPFLLSLRVKSAYTKYIVPRLFHYSHYFCFFPRIFLGGGQKL